MSVIDIGGVALNYHDVGPRDAAAVLLIMGLGAPLTRWPVTFVERLTSAGFRVVSFDNRDVGASRKFEELGTPSRGAVAYPITALVDDALGIVDGLGLGQVHIVGASMGGVIAQIMAATHTGRARSLTSIMSTTGAPSLPPPSARVRELFSSQARIRCKREETDADREEALMRSACAARSSRYPTAPDAVAARVRAEVAGGFSVAGRARQAAALASAGDRTRSLATVAIPTLVIHGDEDEVFPRDHGRATAAAIPHAVLRVVCGLGHELPDTAASTIADLVIAFLCGLEVVHHRG